MDAHLQNLTRPAVIIKFTSVSCGPCRAIHPQCVEWARHYQGIVDLLVIDVDEQPELARHHAITALPTFVVYFKGAEDSRYRVVGADTTKLRTAFVALGDGVQKDWSTLPEIE